ncbi:hypothetical protein NDU88_000667, partial [Pleurodeles waltl]
VDALIDTGASINVIATSVLQCIPFQPHLRPTTTQVYTFGSAKPLPLVGVFTTLLSHEGQSIPAKVFVTTMGSDMLLSCRTAEQLNLISFAFSVHLGTVENLLTEFQSLFDGIGCL